jgi:heme-degrading monooxygenase HmoA
MLMNVIPQQFITNNNRDIFLISVTDTNVALKEFLQARNPKQQHSATLESYLIKPIQRILKYPLLLQQLCNLTDQDTDEHYHLSGKSS